MKGIQITPDFVKSHIIFVDPTKPDHFVSKNGLIGFFSSKLSQATQPKSLLVLNQPTQAQINPTSLFSS
jgi:hypothetical protein